MSKHPMSTVMLTGDGVTFMEDIMEQHVDKEEPVEVNKPEFGNVSFTRLLMNEYHRGYNEGMTDRQAEFNSGLRKRISNQRRELRRLNRQLNAIQQGLKIIADRRL